MAALEEEVHRFCRKKEVISKLKGTRVKYRKPLPFQAQKVYLFSE